MGLTQTWDMSLHHSGCTPNDSSFLPQDAEVRARARDRDNQRCTRWWPTSCVCWFMFTHLAIYFRYIMIHPPFIIHHNPFVKPTINQYSSSGHRWSVTPSELNQPGNHGLELNWWTRSWLSYKLKITINIQLWMFFMIFIMPCQSLGSLMFF